MTQEHAAHTSLGCTKASRLQSTPRTASAVRGVQAARYSHPHAKHATGAAHHGHPHLGGYHMLGSSGGANV